MNGPLTRSNATPVMVTGVGLITPAGKGGREEAARQNRMVLGRPETDPEPGGDRYLGQTDWTILLGPRGLRHLSRGTLYLMAAARMALDDARLSRESLPPGMSLGMIAGTLTGNAALVADFDRTTLTEGAQAVNPAIFPQTVWNSPSSHAAIRFGLEGLNMTMATGLNSGLDALIHAIHVCRAGGEYALLAGGFEELTSFYRLLFAGWGASSPPLSEGASVLVLERADRATARGAAPLALLWSGKSVYCPSRPESPAPLGPFRRALVEETLTDAGVDPSDVSHLWHLHPGAGNALPAEDLGTFFTNGPGRRPSLVRAGPLLGCSGGLWGAHAAALAACGDGAGLALILAEDGQGRMATLLLETR